MPRIRTFFYGSYMNPAVLREVGLNPGTFEVARLDGFDITIAPRANLVRSSQHCVYGVLTDASHDELARLYAHAKDVLGEIYLPHPVLVQTSSGAWFTALCYIAASMAVRPPDLGYVARIVAPARDFGLPDWYIARLEAAGRP